MEQKKEIKTVRLKRLEEKLALIQKTKDYLENELRKVREKEAYTRDKMGKERQAIVLVNKAKKLR
jgi:hypothetical protein